MNIEFDYNQTMKQADKLEEIANNISKIASSDIEQSLATLKSGWEGDVASEYLAKGTQLQEKTENVSKSLMDAANRLNIAEQMVMDIANKRSY